MELLIDGSMGIKNINGILRLNRDTRDAYNAKINSFCYTNTYVNIPIKISERALDFSSFQQTDNCNREITNRLKDKKKTFSQVKN